MSFTSSSSSRRVVVTGIGAVTPLGLTAQETWKNCVEGKSGVGPISLFDTKDCPVTIAGEVKGFDVTKPLPAPLRPAPDLEVTQPANPKDARKMGRFIHLALGAGLEAYADSGLEAVRSKVSPERMGINIGAGMGGLPEIESIHLDLVNKGYRRVTPFLIPEIIANMSSGQLSILLNLQGPNLCTVTACSSSAHSIGESMRLIQRGDADIMLAGGAECVISPLGIGGFAAMKALSTRNNEPTRASRPFDKDRDGFVMGEGSTVLVLEEYEMARARGAKIYGEILGYGLSGDAYHMTTPAPEGAGGLRSMQMAVKNSGISIDKIGYVNAHGTSTPAGDVEESRAVARLFGEHRGNINVSSTKSMTGHLLGAAGATEALFSLLAIRDGIIPPTINLDSLDPGCAELGIDFTAHHAQKKKIDYALSNSFGFGGTNASLLVGRV